MLPLGLAVVRRYAAERAQLERIGRIARSATGARAVSSKRSFVAHDRDLGVARLASAEHEAERWVRAADCTAILRHELGNFGSAPAGLAVGTVEASDARGQRGSLELPDLADSSGVGSAALDARRALSASVERIQPAKLGGARFAAQGARHCPTLRHPRVNRDRSLETARTAVNPETSPQKIGAVAGPGL